MVEAALVSLAVQMPALPVVSHGTIVATAPAVLIRSPEPLEGLDTWRGSATYIHCRWSTLAACRREATGCCGQPRLPRCLRVEARLRRCLLPTV